LESVEPCREDGVSGPQMRPSDSLVCSPVSGTAYSVRSADPGVDQGIDRRDATVRGATLPA